MTGFFKMSLSCFQMDLIKKSTKLLHKRIGTAFGVLACTQNMILKCAMRIYPSPWSLYTWYGLSLSTGNGKQVKHEDHPDIFWEFVCAFWTKSEITNVWFFATLRTNLVASFYGKAFSSWFADATVVDSAPQLLRSRSDPLVWLTHMGLGWILIDTLCAQSQSITLWMFLLLRSWILIRQQPYQYSECQESSPGPWCEGRFYELW